MTDRIDTATEREKLAALNDHTPGPWLDDIYRHDAPYQNISIEANRRSICRLWIDDAPVADYNREQRQNARLIVAAPDLKETVAKLCDALDAKDAEIERLREALKSCPPTSNPTVTADYHLERINAWWKNIARAALNPEGGE